MPFMFVDFDFFETYGIDVATGRGFSEDFADRMSPEDGKAGLQRAGFVLNALAARELGWTPDEAIGKWLEASLFDHRGDVVGVVADVLFESIHSATKPLLYAVPPDEMFGFPALRSASIKITGQNLEGTLAYIDETWAELVPDQPVSRRFLDADFEAMYSAERRQAWLLSFFSIFAVCIACLGLFGLAMFTSERRVKEIGIRKIAGGNVWDIVGLLTAEFSRLVLLSNLIAWPVAYLLMRAWLAGFAYRIDLGPLLFFGSAAIAFAVAWVTVGAVAARAAQIRPALALKSE
jgi:putative ABC transport system permease protein